MFENAMIDMETLSIRPMGHILTIGAVLFNIGHVDEENAFYRRINYSSCVVCGLVIDEDTRKWWDKQDPDARRAAFLEEPRIPIRNALEQLDQFVDGVKYVWSHGSTFDVARLETLYDAFRLPIPWHYRAPRDTRTLFDLAPDMPYIEPLIKHHAMHDAIAQAHRVSDAWAHIMTR